MRTLVSRRIRSAGAGLLAFVLVVALAGCLPTGTVLHGTVTVEGTGEPAAGASVRVYAADTETLVAKTVADAAGGYDLQTASLPDGTYRVLFSTDDWWEDADSWGDATDVTINASARLRIDASVTLGTGEVNGRVLADGHVVPAKVEAISAVTGDVIAVADLVGGEASTGFTFNDLAEGEYRLRMSDGGDWAPRYYGGSITAADAEVVTVVAGETLELDDTELPPHGTLSVSVTDGTGPLGGVLVVVQMVGANEPPQSDITNDDYGNTNLAGLSEVGYRILLVDTEGTYPGVFVNDGTNPITYTPVALTELHIGTVDIRTGRLVDMGAGGTISGTVRSPDDSELIAGATVEALDATTGAVVATTTQSADTNFFLEDLPDGAYRVRATAPGYELRWFPDAAEASDATVITVAAGQTASFHPTLALPVAPPARPQWSDVSAGSHHTCAVEDDNTIRCGGWNELGQTDVLAGEYTAVSAGSQHTCGLTVSDTIACWGNNWTGAASPPGGLFRAVSAGSLHTCALTDQRRISCWGDDARGQLQSPIGTYREVSAGSLHTCALHDAGFVLCWGSNSSGQASAPGGSFQSVSAGVNHSCAVTTAGTVTCWGNNSYGQATAPAGTFSAVSAGSYHTCALATDGTVSCWGNNGYGQAAPPAGTYLDVALGELHTCAVSTNHDLTCWGNNSFGQWDLGE